MFLDLIDLGRVKRGAIYMAVIILFQGTQNLLISYVRLMGVKALYMPALVVAIGMFEGSVSGGFLGMFAGFILDGSFSENSVLFTALFTLMGFFSGYLTEFYINKRLFSFLFMAAASLLITSFCQGIRAMVFHGTDFYSVTVVALSQALWSLPFAIPAYFVCKAIAREEIDQK